MPPFHGSQNSKYLLVCFGDLAGRLGYRSTSEPVNEKVHRVMLLLLAAAALACLSLSANPQSARNSAGPSAVLSNSPSKNPVLTYVRPTQMTMARNYAFDAFGPYPIVGAAFTAGINQLGNSPPEWHKELKVISSGLALIWGLQPLGRQHAMGYLKLSGKIRCITAATAGESFRA